MWAFLGALLLFLHGAVAQRHDSDLFSFVTVSFWNFESMPPWV